MKGLMMDYPLTLTRIFERTRRFFPSKEIVDLEGLLMAHPKVFEACVIAVPHPRWDERPLALVVPKPGQTITAEELLEFLRPLVAKWWLPDGIVFLDAIPKTGVGKFDKKVLRDDFKNWNPQQV